MEPENNNLNDEELKKCKEQAGEYLNNWKRERADFINYKKDEAKRMEEFLKFSNEGIITELIDVIDGVETARNNLPESKELKEWTDGFDGSLDKLDKFLKKFGVEKIEVNGEKFDPLLHEAVEIQDKNGENIIEIRPGYTMHGKVIRPARVKIIK
ncbi:MAG: nucleotide exchange factor GrpE [bacterium]|nr:nucleotide exchange factor GrpE [bacterium]